MQQIIIPSDFPPFRGNKERDFFLNSIWIGHAIKLRNEKEIKSTVRLILLCLECLSFALNITDIRLKR